jgi:hypothetical protein
MKLNSGGVHYVCACNVNATVYKSKGFKAEVYLSLSIGQKKHIEPIHFAIPVSLLTDAKTCRTVKKTTLSSLSWAFNCSHCP